MWSGGKIAERRTMEPFISAEEVAAHLKITRRQVLEMTRRGIIPGYPLGIGSTRRVWRYKLSEIDAIVAGGRKEIPEPAFCTSDTSGKITSGSLRSQKGKP
jgi:excisionase family DNA binding protein